MASTVFVNSRGVVHKGSGGMNITFPDVCKTPSPAGPIPIPYPNIGKSSNTADATTTVKCDGKKCMVKGANYSSTTGDEAGTAGGGIVSSSTRGKAEFMLYSFDVKFDGKNVCRMGDPLFHNKKNIMG
ncbi:MAG: DUF4150 domain-containing protein [Deltaproteobacteria bacterium]|nr:DUF4150 domain-containing protein [Deltaproteobacteria bacterium]